MAAGLLERPLAVKDAQQVLEVDTDQGLVRAVVSVTGVVDEVGDLIEPGAYTKTLRTRTPKTCDGHDWAKPIGVCAHAEEWMPGDPRLPQFTKDGKPWPAAAGALVCDIQFNMESERGQQAFKDVRFYSERNVAEWSIGYQVPDGKATRDRDGVRRIKEVDLYTVDPVLFGAAPLSMTLDIKSARAAVARHSAVALPADEEIERKGGDPEDAPDGLTQEFKYDTSPVGTPGGRQNWVDKCFPGDVRVAAGSRVKAVYRYWYEGLLVKVRTVRGVEVTATPNHPLLTDAGWKPLQEIQLGEKLVLPRLGESISGGQPGVERVPPEIGEVYRAADETRPAERVRADAVNFHGDVAYGDVDVVEVDVELSDVLNAVPSEQVNDSGFVLPHRTAGPVARGRHASDGPLATGTKVAHPECGGGVAVAEKPRFPGTAQSLSVLPEDSVDHCVVDAEAFSDGRGGDARAVLPHDRVSTLLDVPAAKGVGLREGTEGDSRLGQPLVDGGPAHAKALRELGDRRPSAVTLDEVVDIEWRPFVGHVYDLSTDAGWYVANGVIVHNSGGLPAFIRAIAHALIRNGKSEGNAIQIAVGTVQRWARGEGNVSAKTRAKAAAALAEWEKKRAESHVKSLVYDPALEIGPDAGHVEGKAAAHAGTGAEDTLEMKAFPNLPGTFEERLETIRQAVTAALRGWWNANGSDPDQDNDNDTSDRGPYVSVEGTTDTAVIASLWEPDGDRRTYQMDYTISGGGDVLLSDPEEVRLTVVPQPVGAAGDAPGDGLDEDLDEWLSTIADWMPPVDGMVKDASAALSKVLALTPETKAGRVLSGANAGLLRQAVEHLIAVLKAAGIDVNPDQAPADTSTAAPDSTAPTTATPVGAVAEKALDVPDPAGVLASIDAALTR